VKVLIIGCGGIGSFLVRELADAIRWGQFEGVADLADPDVVEFRQLRYQNFTEADVGRNKAEALAERYNRELGADVFRAVPTRIAKPSQLKGYDLVVLCVDNDPTRKLVIEHAHRNGVEFLDLRATGRRVFAVPKLTLKENLKFVDAGDRAEYSCQEGADLKNGRINLGNRIVAVIGAQMLLNLTRGHKNRIVSLVV